MSSVSSAVFLLLQVAHLFLQFREVLDVLCKVERVRHRPLCDAVAAVIISTSMDKKFFICCLFLLFSFY